MILGQEIRKAIKEENTAAERLEAMWIAYWDFAFEHQELYQLMYGVDMNCCEVKKSLQEAEAVSRLFFDTIREVMDDDNPADDLVCRKHYTFWSVIHGLISINMVNKGRGDQMNQLILHDAIKGIIKYIND